MLETLHCAGVLLGYPGDIETWQRTSDGSGGSGRASERIPDWRPEDAARRQPHLAGTRTRPAAVQLENELDVKEHSYLAGTPTGYAGRRQCPPVTPVSFAQDLRLVETARIMTENGR